MSDHITVHIKYDVNRQSHFVICGELSIEITDILMASNEEIRAAVQTMAALGLTDPTTGCKTYKEDGSYWDRFLRTLMVNSDAEPIPISESQGCICDIMDLMRSGCQCKVQS